MYYDEANRLTDSVNVGTNGGSSWTRPGTVPSRSDTVLVTSQSYNSAGWVEDVTDPMGVVTRTEYDALGQVAKTVENYTNGTVTDTSNKTVTYDYEAPGLMKELSVRLTGGGEQTTAWVYGVTTGGGSGINSDEVVVETRHPDPSTGAASSTEDDEVTVNALGETLTTEDRNGNVHTFTYDVLGRMTSDAVTTLGSGVDGAVRRLEFAYDGQGNRSQLTSYDASSGGNVVNEVEREYNGLGQLTEEYQEHGGAVNTMTSPSVGYAYSEMPSGANHSRLTTLTYPDGHTVTWNYNTGLDADVSRLSSLSTSTDTWETYDYLGLGTVVERDRDAGFHRLTYLKQGMESNGDAGDQYNGLDRFGRIVDQRWIEDDGTELTRFQYGYDRAGNRLWRDDLVDSTFGELYAYDDLYQITSFDRGTLNGTKDGLTGSASRSQDWDHDNLGNFDSVTEDGGSPVTRTHNKQNEITAITGFTTPTYDSNGNLTTDQSNQDYQYDAWDRVVEVLDSMDSTLVEYEHDAHGRRIERTADSTTTHLYYSNNWQVLEERVGSSTLADLQYLWSPVYVDALILRAPGSEWDTDADWAMYDANYNITAIADGLEGTGQISVLERYAYDPFGEADILSATYGSLSASSYGWEYTFQGLRGPDTAGNYDVRRREYHSVIGRTTQRDPVGFNGQDPNLYRWEANSPIGRLDPFGLKSVHIVSGVGDEGGKPDSPFYVCIKCKGFSKLDDRLWLLDRTKDAYNVMTDALRDVKRLYWAMKGGWQFSDDLLQTQASIKEWFFGGDEIVGLDCLATIIEALGGALKGISASADQKTAKCREPIEFYNDFDDDEAVAYWSTGWGHIGICGDFWDYRRGRSTAIMIHEISHGWGGTVDNGYWAGGFGPEARYEDEDGNLIPGGLGTEERCENASTIEWWIYYNYIN